jgi:hypothetical protein
LEPETINIRVIDPTTHPYPSHACPPPCALPPPHTPFAAHYRHPRPLLQRTHRHHRRQKAPLPMPRLLPRVTCSITTTPHPPEHPRSPITPPTGSLNSHLAQSKNSPDKIPSTKLQATPFSTPSPLRSQCLVILGLKTVAHGS